MVMNKKIISISVGRIFPNTYQPRKYFNEQALLELAESIKQYGVIQPITVRAIGENYELVAGERRWRASRLAGLEYVPCNVIEITDTQSAEVALLENLQREDLNFMEEAEAYYNLINEHNFTQEEIAKRMGKKQSTIANKLRLLRLGTKIRKLCLENNLTERHARALLALPDEELQFKIINKIVIEELNVKKTEELINRELLILAGKQLNEKKKNNIKRVIPGKLYVNTIKQVFTKHNIPAKYGYKELDDHIEIVVSIPKN